MDAMIPSLSERQQMAARLQAFATEWQSWTQAKDMGTHVREDLIADAAACEAGAAALLREQQRDAQSEDHLDIYVPGVLRCPQCSFELTQATLFVGSGEIGLTREQAYCKSEPCPNDGTPMVKVRWSERAQQNYEAHGALMNEIIGIAGLSVTCESLPKALSVLRSRVLREQQLAEQIDKIATELQEAAEFNAMGGYTAEYWRHLAKGWAVRVRALWPHTERTEP